MKEIRIHAGLTKTIIHAKEVTQYVIEEQANVVIIVVLYAGEQSVTVRLIGKEGTAQIIGIGNLSGSDQAILHTLQHHENSETVSNLLVKAVLSDKASFYYDGSIRVEKSGQKTDAYQRNENLLLSDSAFAQSKPSLEILANDVRCTHGATISTIDPDQLFFLATRGISQLVGKQLIVQGFLESAFSNLSDTIAIKQLKEDVWRRLSKQRQ